MIVTGFQSKISALQFEWAWQNPHLSRHISATESVRQFTTSKQLRPSGRIVTKISRPSSGLENQLSYLHLLLRSKSFNRLPLGVRFFAKDVFTAWNRICDRTIERVGKDVRVILTPPSVTHSRDSLDTDAEHVAKRALDQNIQQLSAIDISYLPAKNHLQKSTSILSETISSSCTSCKKDLHKDTDLLLLCPSDTCSAVMHLKCLSKTWLEQGADPHALLPTRGSCPSCQISLIWADLVRDLSLRMRGEKETQTLLRTPRIAKSKQFDGDAQSTHVSTVKSTIRVAPGFGATSLDADEGLANDDSDADDFDNIHLDDDDDNNPEYREFDEHILLSSDTEDDFKSKPSLNRQAYNIADRPKLPSVIEDSDWDDIEEIVK